VHAVVGKHHHFIAVQMWIKGSLSALFCRWSNARWQISTRCGKRSGVSSHSKLLVKDASSGDSITAAGGAKAVKRIPRGTGPFKLENARRSLPTICGPSGLRSRFCQTNKPLKQKQMEHYRAPIPTWVKPPVGPGLAEKPVDPVQLSPPCGRVVQI
jgi:hypothetical protein